MKPKSGNPGGRPRSFDRDTVLDAAVQVFWEKGYEGASLDELTRAMGINRPSLYGAFGNKHGLFLEAIDRYRAVQGKAQAAPLHAEADIVRAVAQYFDRIIDTVAPAEGPCGCLVVSVATEVAERDAVVRETVATGLERTAAFLDGRLEAAGCLSQARPEVTGAMILSAGMSLAQQARLGTPPDRLRAIARGYVALFFNDRTARPEDR